MVTIMNGGKDLQSKDTVFLDKAGIVNVLLEGKQTYQAIRHASDEMDALSSKLRREGKPVYVLVDISKMGGHDSGARREGYERLFTIYYDKFAMFGGGLFLKSVANLVVKATKLGNKVKVFNTREEAIRWLKS